MIFATIVTLPAPAANLTLTTKICQASSFLYRRLLAGTLYRRHLAGTLASSQPTMHEIFSGGTKMFRDRGYLPHLEIPESTYFLTFRLADTLPFSVMRAFEIEKTQLLQSVITRGEKLIGEEQKRLNYLQSKRIQEYLDKGIGECWLGKREIAEIVANSIEFFESKRYISHVWCIMPNHVHWLMTPAQNESLTKITHSIKSFSAHQANKKLNRNGAFWNHEYYDHCVRSSEEFGRLVMYTLNNPVKAGLCKEWQEWKWLRCSEEIQTQLSYADVGER
jgi:REP element-mobilizing transposase RayT